MDKALTEEQVYKKISEIYNSEKGKGFITHLLRSFLPIQQRSNYMFEKNDKKVMNCSITRVPLLTKDDVFKYQLENFDELFTNFVDRMMGSDVKPVIEEAFKGKLLAVECKNSEKLLSPIALQQLNKFAINEMLNGNKHIAFVINDEVKKIAKANVKVNKESKPVQPEKKPILHSTTKLGDYDALSKLKEKFEKEGK
jgi:hypothetical protein